jgi:hypothetical protein
LARCPIRRSANGSPMKRDRCTINDPLERIIDGALKHKRPPKAKKAERAEIATRKEKKVKANVGKNA